MGICPTSFRPLSRWIGLYLIMVAWFVMRTTGFRPLSRWIGLYPNGFEKLVKADYAGFRPLSRWIGLYLNLKELTIKYTYCFRPLSRWIGLYPKVGWTIIGLVVLFPSPLEVDRFISFYRVHAKRPPNPRSFRPLSR